MSKIEESTIKLAIKLRKQGLKYRQIVEEFKKLKITAPSGKEWQPASISRMVVAKNPKLRIDHSNPSAPRLDADTKLENIQRILKLTNKTSKNKLKAITIILDN